MNTRSHLVSCNDSCLGYRVNGKEIQLFVLVQVLLIPVADIAHWANCLEKIQGRGDCPPVFDSPTTAKMASNISVKDVNTIGQNGYKEINNMFLIGIFKIRPRGVKRHRPHICNPRRQPLRCDRDSWGRFRFSCAVAGCGHPGYGCARTAGNPSRSARG